MNLKRWAPLNATMSTAKEGDRDFCRNMVCKAISSEVAVASTYLNDSSVDDFFVPALATTVFVRCRLGYLEFKSKRGTLTSWSGRTRAG